MIITALVEGEPVAIWTAEGELPRAGERISLQVDGVTTVYQVQVVTWSATSHMLFGSLVLTLAPV